MITIIDYNAGNIRSVERALLHLGYEVTCSNEPKELEESHCLILPGQGSFGQAMDTLESLNVIPIIKAHIQKKKP